jgi:hypothetical protein
MWRGKLAATKTIDPLLKIALLPTGGIEWKAMVNLD